GTDLLGIAAERWVMREACRPVIPDRNAIIDRKDADFVAAVRDQLAAAEKRLIMAREQVETWLAEATSRLEGGSTEEKLSAIPGDAIIQLIFKAFGLHFNKRKDGPKIANVMTADEIAQEMRELLTEIAKD